MKLSFFTTRRQRQFIYSWYAIRFWLDAKKNVFAAEYTHTLGLEGSLLPCFDHLIQTNNEDNLACLSQIPADISEVLQEEYGAICMLPGLFKQRYLEGFKRCYMASWNTDKYLVGPICMFST